MSTLPSPAADETRRKRLLDAALSVFLRYGFKKTSMDEVARAADLSRQGLYLHFASKEALFRATLQHTLDASLAAATAELERHDQALPDALAAAFDAWIGRYIGLFTAGASDLAATSAELAGTLAADYEARFAEAVTRTLRRSGLMAAYRRSGLTASQLADTLVATARGLKYSSPTREAFRASMAIATRALCAALEETR